MKRKIRAAVALLLLLVLCLAGCTEAATLDPTEISAKEPLPTNEWGVTLTAENVTPTGLTLVCACGDGTEERITTNSVFKIYGRQGDVWVPYERTDGEFGYKAWDDTFHEIPAGDAVSLESDWTWLHGQLPAGEYLAMKRFFADDPIRENAETEIFFVYAPFAIE